MRHFFIIFFACILGGCNSDQDMGGMYDLISDDPSLQHSPWKSKAHAFRVKAPAIDILDQWCNRTLVQTTLKWGRLHQQKWPAPTFQPSIAISKICGAFQGSMSGMMA